VTRRDRDPALRVVIVDDEPLARDCVRLALAREEAVEVVAECPDGASAIEAILALDPDLVFLDVQMPGIDGFEVIARVGAERMPPVVFVTAYDEYALRAFEVHAIDYVLKPFDDSRFRAVVAHARSRVGTDARGEQSIPLERLLRDSGRVDEAGYARRVMVEADERIRFVPVEEVDYLEAEGNYVRLSTGATTYRIRTTLTGLLQQLDPARFVRIHRSTAVNLDWIQEIQPWFGGDFVAILRSGAKLRVSRRYRHGLLRTTL
jgi:two-component system, LytTR family, response regulator